MEDYIGKICPFCKMDIKEGDAVKVCPACGIPHHKVCWEKNRGCTTSGCSEKYDEVHKVSSVTVCARCGAELHKGQKFCTECGQKVGETVEVSSPSTARQFDSDVQETTGKKKKSFSIFAVVAVIIIAAIIVSIIVVPKIFKSTSDYLMLGDYENAYKAAKSDEKEDILFENLIACIAKDIPDSMKNPGSFKLRDAWYDRSDENVVLLVSGTNSYGGTVSSYWYYTFDEDDDEWGLWCTLSDLEDEKTNSWDDTEDIIEKIIYNNARKVVRNIIADDSMKLDKDNIENINYLFEENILDDVEPLDID